MAVEEAKAFKASWPGTVHKTYNEARAANITYLVDEIFKTEYDDQAMAIAATALRGAILSDGKQQRVRNLLEALVKEL